MVEPDQTNDRMRRSLEDRYVSIRPDIDGISFLHAAIASADADAINQVLDALAAIALPGDTRTFQQRRADACTELLLGKISNGCHVSWQDDPDNDDDEDEDEDEDEDGRAPARAGTRTSRPNPTITRGLSTSPPTPKNPTPTVPPNPSRTPTSPKTPKRPTTERRSSADPP